MAKFTDAVKAEIRKILPDDVKVGDLLPLSTGDHVRIEELRPDGTFGYRLIDGPIKQVTKSKGTITTSNINLSTSGMSGVDIHVPDTPEIQVNVETKKDDEIENESDPYNWYLKRILRRT